MSGLIDRCGRQIDHLRLSLTSNCNLRCRYCRPSAADRVASSTLMSDRQRLELVKWMYESFGLQQVRLTGGEPLLHPAVESLIADLRDAAPGLSVAMTTNACLLSRRAEALRTAGLGRLNISLDTLDPSQYRRLTGGDLGDVLAGIDAARAAGFAPPRVNTVALRGVNDFEWPALASWALARGMEIRFLEAMPIGPAGDFNRARFVSAHEVLRSLRQVFSLEALPRESGETAVRYRAQNCTTSGVIGIIAPISEAFCGQCRRIRVTAEGRLYPCLLDSRSTDLLPIWREGRFDASTAESLVRSAVADKPHVGPVRQTRPMVTLGG